MRMVVGSSPTAGFVVLLLVLFRGLLSLCLLLFLGSACFVWADYYWIQEDDDADTGYDDI
jgi:hypothetical protein